MNELAFQIIKHGTITNRRRGWQISEQLQLLLRIENRDYAHGALSLNPSSSLTRRPIRDALEAAPEGARLGVGRTDWRIYNNRLLISGD